MRVLVITRAPWRNDNNTGNTMTNFFEGMEGVEFYSLYFRDQLPENNIALRSFAISEGQLIRNILKKTPVGKEVKCTIKTSSKNEEKVYKNAKKFGTVFLTWMRDALWTIGRWKSDSFKQYLKDINPEIVFMPVFNCCYPHRVLQFVKEQTGAKIVLFHADDNYTLKQFSLSPFYWLYRFLLRKWVKRTVKISSLNYAISNIQKREYEEAFDKPFKVLTKGLFFGANEKITTENNNPLQMVFTGNIGVNRWKSLGMIASVLKDINKEKTKIEMKIYTATPITTKMDRALNIDNASKIMGYIGSEEVASIQSNADILIHVEAMDLRNKLLVRQSFSTKIVDYFSKGKCILALGSDDVASIDYLKSNDAAVVVCSKKELEKKLNQLIKMPEMISEYGKKAWECGKNYHEKSKIQCMLMEDMEKVIKQNESIAN